MTNIRLITLGGTIAMRDDGQGAVPALGPDALVATRDLDGGGITVTGEALFSLPSGHLTMTQVYELARRIAACVEEGCDGLVITHGTDSMEEIAFALELTLRLECPVILTGAMRAASHAAPDGPGNLRQAILAAACRDLACSGVLVAMNEQLFAARDVTKGHSQRTDAFRARDGGPVAMIAEDRVKLLGLPQRLPRLALPRILRARVPILTTFLGDDGGAARALAAAGIDGLVVEGFGGGRTSPTLADALGDMARHLPVVIASRCATGPTARGTYGYVGGEIDLIRRGIIPAGSLSGIKARVALAILLDGGADMAAVMDFFAAC